MSTGSALLILLLLVSCSMLEAKHQRRHRNWKVVAVPVDDNEEKQVIDDLFNRLQDWHLKDEVFDTSSTLAPPTSAPSASAPPNASQLFHPYMRMLDEEIDERRNEKWIQMDLEGKPNIRGIEPIKINDLEANKTVAMTFSVGTISNMDSITHVDLVVSSCDDCPLRQSLFSGPQSLQVDLRMDRRTLLPIKLQTFHKTFEHEERKWSFLVLEMTPTIKRWWSSGFLNASSPTIQLSTANGSQSLRVLRPLLVFYYVTNRVPRTRRSSGIAYGGFRPQPSPKQANQGIAFGQVKGGPRQNETAGARGAEAANHLCSHRNWSVTIQELNWDILIIYPLTLQINYCAGSCEAPMDEFTMNAYARSSLLISNTYNHTKSLPHPFCVPTQLDREKVVLATNKTSIQITYMESLVATQCGCR